MIKADRKTPERKKTTTRLNSCWFFLQLTKWNYIFFLAPFLPRIIIMNVLDACNLILDEVPSSLVCSGRRSNSTPSLPSLVWIESKKTHTSRHEKKRGKNKDFSSPSFKKPFEGGENAALKKMRLFLPPHSSCSARHKKCKLKRNARRSSFLLYYKFMSDKARLRAESETHIYHWHSTGQFFVFEALLKKWSVSFPPVLFLKTYISSRQLSTEEGSRKLEQCTYVPSRYIVLRTVCASKKKHQNFVELEITQLVSLAGADQADWHSYVTRSIAL